jgi:hypothetical protein
MLDDPSALEALGEDAGLARELLSADPLASDPLAAGPSAAAGLAIKDQIWSGIQSAIGDAAAGSAAGGAASAEAVVAKAGAAASSAANAAGAAVGGGGIIAKVVLGIGVGGLVLGGALFGATVTRGPAEERPAPAPSSAAPAPEVGALDRGPEAPSLPEHAATPDGQTAPSDVPHDPDARAPDVARPGAGRSPAPPSSVVAAAPTQEPRPTSTIGRERQPVEEALRVREASTLIAAGQPGKALSVLAELDKDVPGGMLAQERMVLRIEALAASGQGEQAAKLGEAFLAAHPKSAHADRVRPHTRK